MADTNTPNIGLLLPDLGDTFNFALHVENNFSTIDSLMGAVDCTSTTRPSNTYKGQVIYEHDSGRYAQNTGTKAAPVWTYTSHAALAVTSSTHPTSGLSAGELIFETDTGLSAVYNGSAYLYGVQQASSTVTLGSTTASVTFSGLPATNGFLVKWAARASDAVAAEMFMLRINGDSGSNYARQANEANNTSTATGIQSAPNTAIQVGTIPAASGTARYWGTGSFVVNPGTATGSGQNTSVAGHGVAVSTNTNMWAGVYGGQWNSTATVTSLTMFGLSGSLVQNSKFSIYALP